MSGLPKRVDRLHALERERISEWRRRGSAPRFTWPHRAHDAERRARQNHKIITLSKYKRQMAKEGLLSEEERERYRQRRRRRPVRAACPQQRPARQQQDESDSLIVGFPDSSRTGRQVLPRARREGPPRLRPSRRKTASTWTISSPPRMAGTT